MKWNGKHCLIIACALLFIGCSPNNQNNKDLKTELIPFPKQLSSKKGNFSTNTIHIIHHLEFKKEANYLNQFFINYCNTPTTLVEEKHNEERILKNIILKKIGQEDHSEDYYKIDITSKEIIISAGHNKGIFYGIQSIMQLTRLNNQKNSIELIYPCIEIEDWAEFPHRGMLMDCCRHFFEINTIKKYIDLLALYKMNILHWHLTEDQGWRIEIEKYPKLNEIGSWRSDSNGIYGGYYTKDQIREIVKYATDRHIEIIPEIELPGHSQAALASYPYLSCTGNQIKVANQWGVFKEIYCAGNDSVFEFLTDIFNEVTELFPSKYIHIGGDEAPKYRWENCEKCQNRISMEKLHDEHELQSYFIGRIAHILREKGKTIIGWDEILEGGLIDGAIVQSWRGVDGGIKAVKMGNKAIMSPTSHAYFDYDIKTTDLFKVYSFDPIPENLRFHEKKLIIGGECNLWSERIENEQDLDQKTFPRLLAMSEVLWSYPQKRDSFSFRKRVSSQYAILKDLNVQYGIEVEPSRVEVEIKENKLLGVIIPGHKDLSFKYKWNEEKKIQATNNLTFPIDKTGQVSIQAYSNNIAYGNPKLQTFILHIANGCEISYKNKYSEYYPSNKDIALTDGKTGSLDFKDGNWQGFFGKNIECIIDLEKTKVISSIGANFYQYTNSWIFLPKNIQTSTSKDSITWTIWDKKEDFSESKKRGKFIKSTETSNDSIHARYIKFKAENMGKIPEWHEAAGSNTWIFIDEIIVK